MQKKLELCMVLEIVLLQDHIQDLVYKAVNSIAVMKIEGKITSKNLKALSTEKSTYTPNQGKWKRALLSGTSKAC